MYFYRCHFGTSESRGYTGKSSMDPLSLMWHVGHNRRMKPVQLEKEIQEMIDKKMSIECQMCYKPGRNVPYRRVRQGIFACNECYQLTLCETCSEEKRKYELLDSGKHKGSCTQCASCDECGAIMWDHFCGCHWR